MFPAIFVRYLHIPYWIPDFFRCYLFLNTSFNSVPNSAQLLLFASLTTIVNFVYTISYCVLRIYNQYNSLFWGNKKPLLIHQWTLHTRMLMVILRWLVTAIVKWLKAYWRANWTKYLLLFVTYTNSKIFTFFNYFRFLSMYFW